MRKISFSALALALMAPSLMGGNPPANAAEDPQLAFFKELAETRTYSLGRPAQAQFTSDNSAVFFLRSGPRDSVLRLFEMDIKTAKVREVISPEDLLKGCEERLSVAEKARRERMRMTLHGFTSFQLSEDGTQILVGLSGKSYVVRRKDKRITELPGEGWIDPRFSPNGNYVAGVRGGELYVIEVASAKEQAVTRGATETLTHGLAEFAAQEELDRYSGFWWSPDSTRLVFQETDLSAVEKLYIMDPAEASEAPNSFYYPRAGRHNAKVKLGIVSIKGGAITWIPWDAERYPYLARVDWRDSAPLSIYVMTRNQREAKLMTVDPMNGATRDLVVEEDDAWINVPRFSRTPSWLPDGSAFLWTTERRGDTQLDLRDRTGALTRTLTPLGFHLETLLDVDEVSRTAIVSGGPDPREINLYRVSFDGSAPVRISEGAGIHRAAFSKDHRFFIHTAYLLNGSYRTHIRQADGKLLADLPAVAAKPPFIPNLELTRVGKVRTFDAMLVRPRDFQPGRKYPVILSVYAGPGMKMVQASPSSLFQEQWAADRGYIVVSLDGRGTPNHGRDWERAIHGNLIDIALEDQVEGLKALGAKFPELDLSRVGVTGWSFGGYFAAMATIRRPDIFRCGVAGAPVVDWLDYDTCYTERYLDLPSANPDGYRKSNVLTYAKELKRPLLIIHGLTDDNVYVMHSLKLMDALFKAGLPYEFLPLPGTHLSSDPVESLRLGMREAEFFERNLK